MLIKAIKTHSLLLLFLISYIVFSFLTYKTLPIANGEEFRYLRGKETLVHLLQGQFTEKLVQPRPHYFLYNAYTAFLVFLNPSFFYEWFHLINLLFSSIIFIVVYTFSFLYTKNSKFSFFAMVALVFFPPFFGQLGINPIDMPFAVFYILSVLLIYLFADSSKRFTGFQILILGFLFGITQGLRQIGFTIYLLLAIYDLYNIKNLWMQAKLRFFDYLLIFVIANFVMLISWPNFAINYFKSFHWFLFVGQNFYLWDYGLLFMGKFLTNSERPAYYLPLLQLITSPIYISLLFFISIFSIKKLIKNKISFLIISAFTLNYMLYFLLRPVVYDGTRHFMFLVPLIVLISVFGFFEFMNSQYKYLFKLILCIILFINLLSLLVFTFKEFPHHYVYFNKIGYLFGNPNYTFESDYSSTLYKQSALWIRDNYVTGDSMPKVYACDNGYAVDYFSYKKFITTINREEAELIICDYKTLLRNDYGGEVIHTDYLNGVPYNFVLKMR